MNGLVLCLQKNPVHCGLPPPLAAAEFTNKMLLRAAFWNKSIFKDQTNTDIVLMHNTDMERDGGEHETDREMDSTDRAVSGWLIGRRGRGMGG